MTRRVVAFVTCSVVAVLFGAFTVLQWETASRVATIASALASVASVGAGLWAALGAGPETRIDVHDSADSETEVGTAVSGVSGFSGGNITVHRSGGAKATKGDAVSGVTARPSRRFWRR